MMSEHDFSQISITSDQRLVGSLDETHLYEALLQRPEVKREPVEPIMLPAFPFVDADKTFILTRSDVIRVL